MLEIYMEKFIKNISTFEASSINLLSEMFPFILKRI